MAFISALPLATSRPRAAIAKSSRAHVGPLAPRMHRVRGTPHMTTATTSVQSVVEAAKDLGTIRFICISNGAVLETIGRFDYNISTFSVPTKGDYLTIASADKTFECHINTSKVKRVTLSTEKAKMGGHDLHVMRFKDENDALMLSCLLMWDPSIGPGNYLHGAVEQFDKLKQTFGSDFVVS